MKKHGAETIILIMLIPILLAFGGWVHSKTVTNGESIIFLNASRDYVAEDIQEIKDDNKEIKKDLKIILRRLK